MDVSRRAGCIEPRSLELLFRGLEVLESMVGEIREGHDASPAPPELVADLDAADPDAAEEEPEKKGLRRS